jgi:hypothetical protein
MEVVAAATAHPNQASLFLRRYCMERGLALKAVFRSIERYLFRYYRMGNVARQSRQWLSMVDGGVVFQTVVRWHCYWHDYLHHWIDNVREKEGFREGAETTSRFERCRTPEDKEGLFRGFVEAVAIEERRLAEQMLASFAAEFRRRSGGVCDASAFFIVHATPFDGFGKDWLPLGESHAGPAPRDKGEYKRALWIGPALPHADTVEAESRVRSTLGENFSCVMSGILVPKPGACVP